MSSLSCFNFGRKLIVILLPSSFFSPAKQGTAIPVSILPITVAVINELTIFFLIFNLLFLKILNSMILNIMPFHLHTASTALDILRSNLILRVNIVKTNFVLQCGTRSTLFKNILFSSSC